jgi:hypothetical protein
LRLLIRDIGRDFPAPSSASFVQRFSDAFRNHGWIVVRGEENGPLESLRPRDEDFESPSERISRNPGFVRPATCFPPDSTAAWMGSSRVAGMPLDSKTVMGIT